MPGVNFPGNTLFKSRSSPRPAHFRKCLQGQVATINKLSYQIRISGVILKKAGR